MPNVDGETLLAAQTKIEGAGFEFGYSEAPTINPLDDGRVIRQSPSAGALRLEDSRVSVTIGVYVEPEPTTVAVPDVGGLTESVAISRIENAGLVAQVAGTITTTDPGFVGRVMDQDPLPYGADVETGSTVRIWIGKQQQISYPPQKTSPWITLALQGSGHGTTHGVGETLTFCVSWDQLGGEPAPSWDLISYMTNPAGTYLVSNESMQFGGALCPATSISASGAGLKQFVVQIREWSYSQEKWVIKDTADLWIYVSN